jgi:hypothetical protein
VATSHADALRLETERKERRAKRKADRLNKNNTNSNGNGTSGNTNATTVAATQSVTITTVNVQQYEFQWVPLGGDQWKPSDAPSCPSPDDLYRDSEMSKLSAFKFYRMVLNLLRCAML